MSHASHIHISDVCMTLWRLHCTQHTCLSVLPCLDLLRRAAALHLRCLATATGKAHGTQEPDQKSNVVVLPQWNRQLYQSHLIQQSSHKLPYIVECLILGCQHLSTHGVDTACTSDVKVLASPALRSSAKSARAPRSLLELCFAALSAFRRRSNQGCSSPATPLPGLGRLSGPSLVWFQIKTHDCYKRSVGWSA